MLRVGILGNTDSARRKTEIVLKTEQATLSDARSDPRDVIEASEVVVLTDGQIESRSELAVFALRRGRHVFSDWPLVEDAEAARRLSQTADESGVEIAVNRPDRMHPAVLEIRDKAPTLTTVTLAGGGRSDFDDLLTDAVDLCLFLNGGSAIHKYEAEAVRDAAGSFGALSISMRFHSGALALGHIRNSDGPAVRILFAAGEGWSDELDLLDDESYLTDYDPVTDERSFVSCIERLAAGRPVLTPLHDLEETVRSVRGIMTRTRGLK